MSIIKEREMKDHTINKIFESSSNSEPISIKDLSFDETKLSLVLLKCLCNEESNDFDLGRKIRKIFLNLKK